MPNVAKKENIVVDSPLRLVSNPVQEVEGDNRVGYVTEVHIHSRELGVLTPNEYRVVANKSTQAEKLALWALDNIIQKLTSIRKTIRTRYWISCYVSAKALLRGNLKQAILEAKEKGKVATRKLALELSVDAITEKPYELANAMNELKEQFGVQFILSEYGGDFCPVFAIKNFPFDYVMFQSDITGKYEMESAETKLLIEYLREYGVKIIFRQKEDCLTNASEYSDCYMKKGRTMRRRRQKCLE